MKDLKKSIKFKVTILNTLLFCNAFFLFFSCGKPPQPVVKMGKDVVNLINAGDKEKFTEYLYPKEKYIENVYPTTFDSKIEGGISGEDYFHYYVSLVRQKRVNKLFRRYKNARLTFRSISGPLSSKKHANGVIMHKRFPLEISVEYPSGKKATEINSNVIGSVVQTGKNYFLIKPYEND